MSYTNITLSIYIHLFTAVPLTMRDMGWWPPPVTVCRMAGIELLQNLHFHRPWWSERHPSVHESIYSVSQVVVANSCLGSV